jgi:hypothetical protein
MMRFRAGKRGLDSRLVLGDDETPLLDPPRQLRVRRRVVPVDPATEHADGDAVRFERSAMRVAVDAAREAADDDEAGRGEVAAEHPGDLGAVRRARARADDSDRTGPEEVRRAGTSQMELVRRVENRPKARREERIRATKGGHAASSLGER